MKKKIFLLFVMIMAISAVEAQEKFFGVNANDEMVRYSSTATVVDVKDCCCCYRRIVTLAVENQFADNDTIVERVPAGDYDFFINYLTVGDKFDFNQEGNYLSVIRIRPDGKEHNFFMRSKPQKGVAKVLRVKDNGGVVLDNGIIIKRPKQQYEVGDKVCYKESWRYVAMAREIKERVL